MKPRMRLLSSQCGDWEGLYLDGVLIEEGHQIGEGSFREFWLDLARDHDVSSEDLVIFEVDDVDDRFLYKHGTFPNDINKLHGEY